MVRLNWAALFRIFKRYLWFLDNDVNDNERRQLKLGDLRHWYTNDHVSCAWRHLKGDVHAGIKVCIPRKEKEWKLDGIAMWCVIGPQGENEEGPILRDILTWRESRTKARGVCVRKPQTNCFDIEMLSGSIDICCSRRSCFLLWIKSGTFLSCKFSFQYIFLLVCRRSWKQNTKAKLCR